MTRFRLTIEYDGRPFAGWQRQARDPSVQQAIEQAIKAVTGEDAVLHGAGRTDAGVHALAMAAHVDIAKPFEAFRLTGALNALLRPLPVAILKAEAVEADWHARFRCIRRTYVYRIVNRRAPLTVDAGLAWHVSPLLDTTAMHDAAQRLVGLHDFTTFRSAHCQSASPVKRLDRIGVARSGERIEFLIEARSFLHHQVRSMVGCLQMVGRGQWSADDLEAALQARDRAALGLNAPADGLYFVSAEYPEDVPSPNSR